MVDPRIQHDIKNLLLDIARRMAQEENDLDDSEYGSMLDEINEHDAATIASAVLDAYMESDGVESMSISSIIRDLKRCPTLPHETILRMDNVKNGRDNQDMLCKLALLYSTYFYVGLSHLVPLEELIVKYEIEPERVMAFLRSQASIAFQEDGNADLTTATQAVVGEVRARIEGIEAFTRASPFTRNKGMFESPLPIKVRMVPIVQTLNEIKESIYNRHKDKSRTDLSREPFLLPLGPFADDVVHPIGKKIARQVEQSTERGYYAGQLAKLLELEKLEPGNPRVYLEKSLIIRELMGERGEPAFHLCLVELLKAMKAPACKLNIEHFFELASNLQMLGYFHASYLISLILLQINPAEFNSLISAAFNAYQLLRPFNHFLETAAIVDPARLLNFLDEFWIYSRFRPQDSFQRLNVPDEMVTRIEQEVGAKSLVTLDSNSGATDSLVTIGGIIDSLDEILSKQLQKGVVQAIKGNLNDLDLHDRRNKKHDAHDSRSEKTDRAGEGEENDLDDAVNKWFDGVLPRWQKSQLYQQLPKSSWKVRDDIPWMAARLYHDTHGALPGEWTWPNLEHVLVQDFPRKVSAPRYYFKSIGTLLRKFCSFLQESQNIDNFRGFPEKIQQISPRIYERAIEVGPWSIRKEYFF